MRHGRAKAARKTLQYFHRTIGLKAPYAILLDATMVVAMFQQKILPFKERMDRVLQTTGADGPNKYCILQSAVDELRTIHDKLKSKNHSKAESFGQALKFIRDGCAVLDHRKESQRITSKTEEDNNEGDSETDDASSKEEQAPASVQDDLLHHIENDEKPYVVATQDEGLLHTLRSMGTVPIVRLANSSVLIIENPSKQSQRQAKGMERKKWKHSLPDSERQLVNLARKEKRASNKDKSSSSSIGAPHQRNKNKAKGPNPLSCKRKQGAGDKNSKESASKKRRLRAKAKGS
mmetsp:Transcript_24414/g.59785  ORF Transcript_24414/g.59785 Transcript_24414/m.59785 type:complete len:291 (+) Transcript_24414:1124-1996(+)|eukprot:CAMPEP_0113622652 /NCGR_PEP_ID=MMETSP0017_2-20120614/11620_1 /TAXON_ID=2856 /ORGANISM="Cylindrotheca closterium" /LENGTH=290 /DNA_ID=CAMNT_0000532513 /DNA_START=562 /DNA_END=1434 /DNA_ORIENTATION=+ /assembly_acc=CAM_ASM_000147